ncbi:signal recognition particle protein [Euzebya tangerina]|uniref:signal recognition particle protein n=1 Tax=Euzebya tangerina TaxID=591198 RepID=UPI000E30F028|nr:signal recognition particle protein [Euzebya tangerina]
MFDALQDRLDAVFDRFRSSKSLSEDQVAEGLREIRLALLEADVNFKVVKTFTGRIKERAVGSEVSEALDPGQQIIKIVNEELVTILGEQSAALDLGSASPAVIMLAGLQGAGKTTAAGKLAKLLKSKGRSVVLVACDLQRPAAVRQLQVLGERVGVPVFAPKTEGDPVEVAENAIAEAKRLGASVVIVDTAGRTNIDEEMMQQAADIKAAVNPAETLFVIDAMIGQEAVNVARAFQEAVDFTGVILSKLDGDARGGAALSVAEVTGRPIKYASVGEKLEEFEAFHPDRMAGRILGMGDVLTLIEKAEAVYEEGQQEEMAQQLLSGQFTLEDFLSQLQSVRQMGPIGKLMEMIPGMGKAMKEAQAEIDEDDLKRIEAIIQSMTLEERRNPDILNGKRKKRIARGCGRSAQEINELLRSYKEMRKMMKNLGPMMGAMGGGGGTISQARALRKMQKELGGGGDMLEQLAALSGDDPMAMAGMGGPPSGSGNKPVPRRNKKVPKRKKKKRR